MKAAVQNLLRGSLTMCYKCIPNKQIGLHSRVHRLNNCFCGLLKLKYARAKLTCDIHPFKLVKSCSLCYDRLTIVHVARSLSKIIVIHIRFSVVFHINKIRVLCVLKIGLQNMMNYVQQDDLSLQIFDSLCYVCNKCACVCALYSMEAYRQISCNL